MGNEPIYIQERAPGESGERQGGTAAPSDAQMESVNDPPRASPRPHVPHSSRLSSSMWCRSLLFLSFRQRLSTSAPGGAKFPE